MYSRTLYLSIRNVFKGSLFTNAVNGRVLEFDTISMRKGTCPYTQRSGQGSGRFYNRSAFLFFSIFNGQSDVPCTETRAPRHHGELSTP